MSKYEFVRQDYYNIGEYCDFIDSPINSFPQLPEWAKQNGFVWNVLEQNVSYYGVTNILPICCNTWINKKTKSEFHQIRVIPFKKNTVLELHKYDIDEYYGLKENDKIPEWAILIPGCYAIQNGKIVQMYTNTVLLLQKKIKNLSTNKVTEELVEIDLEQEMKLSRKMCPKKW